MARALAELDRDTREDLVRFFTILFKSNLRLTLEGLQEGIAEEAEKRLPRILGGKGEPEDRD